MRVDCGPKNATWTQLRIGLHVFKCMNDHVGCSDRATVYKLLLVVYGYDELGVVFRGEIIQFLSCNCWVYCVIDKHGKTQVRCINFRPIFVFRWLIEIVAWNGTCTRKFDTFSLTMLYASNVKSYRIKMNLKTKFAGGLRVRMNNFFLIIYMCFNLDSRFTETHNVRIAGRASVEIMRTTQDHPLNSDYCVIHDDGRTLLCTSTSRHHATCV